MLTLKDILLKRPIIYEIVPPRRDTSRYHSELRGVEEVLHDSRIDAVNVPELMKRHEGKHARYSPVTIPPEEYALMIKEYKEPIVNIIAPRLARDEFLARARRVLNDYGIRNLVLVGKERREDILPGPGVAEAMGLLRGEKADGVALGGICIFNRVTMGAQEYGMSGDRLTEAGRIWAKAREGCDFVTSQISFDPAPALAFLEAYRQLCDKSESRPLTVFISLTTIPSASILSLVEGLDVVIPPRTKKRILNNPDMGAASLDVATEVFRSIVSESESRGYSIPLGLQVEQVGVNNDELSLRLLDRVCPLFRGS